MVANPSLLAIDPGITSGIAVKMNGEYKAFTIDLITQFYHLIADTKWTAVAYESFSSAGNISAAGHYTIRLTGAIEALCFINGIPWFVHSPQNRYAFMDKARRKLGKVVIHQTDAMAHLLLLELQVERQAH